MSVEEDVVSVGSEREIEPDSVRLDRSSGEPSSVGGLALEPVDSEQQAFKPDVSEATKKQKIEADNCIYNSNDVKCDAFEELVLSTQVVREVQECWRLFFAIAESREAVGDAVYAAVFDAFCGLQSLFKTPRAVMAMRFVNGISQIINTLGDPRALKVVVETLGFQHLDLDVTIPRVVIFRDAIVDLLKVEMGGRFTAQAHEGFATFLNYSGGAYIFVRDTFAARLRVLSSSWAQAMNKVKVEFGIDGITEREGITGTQEESYSRYDTGGSSDKSGSTDISDHAPKSFEQMFLFNTAVMGFGNRTWMNEIMNSWDTIVRHVSNTYRLQEECDVLSLRIAKCKGKIVLTEYKSVMLASLRSLVKDWGSQHEEAWSWLWDNVEQMLQEQLGKPAAREASLCEFVQKLDDKSMGIVRREIYAQFFAIAPEGQDYFKQSTTRLHFIADKILSMTVDIYKDPKKMVEDISAIGLRHVGYGVPTDLFGAFVSACVKVVRMLKEDNQAQEESFRWSLNLISRILTRVIGEGSTIVMKSINANSGKQLRKAISCAPRGQRANWMLKVQVGTQAISPLMWGIETGSLDAAKAIIEDLLTIRADRDRYYYGMDIMFSVHNNIVRRLIQEGPALIPILLDGLIWRSRAVDDGRRRVNYYVKHLLVDKCGRYSKTLERVTENNDPKLACHPALTMVTDMVWNNVVFRAYLLGRIWFIITILVFILSQSVLNHRERSNNGHGSMQLRIAIFVCRAFVYTLSMGQWIGHHIKSTLRDVRAGLLQQRGPLKIPEYLCQWQGQTGLTLTVLLLCMLVLEPTLHCLSTGTDTEYIFTEHCSVGERLILPYSILSTGAMLTYFALLLDMAVFSNWVSAWCLVCGRLGSEVVLFLFGLICCVAAFAAAASTMEQKNEQFAGLHNSMLHFFQVAFGMFSGESFDELEKDPPLLVLVLLFTLTSIIFLVNLLIAQLSCAYYTTFVDMMGYARLKRGKIVSDTMTSVASCRWRRFIDSLHLDACIEFGEGDMGLSGGIQLTEPSSWNVTTVDTIKRFGGSTSPLAQWPEEEERSEVDDSFDRMEKLIEKAMKRVQSTGNGRTTMSYSGGDSTDIVTSDNAGSTSTDKM